MIALKRDPDARWVTCGGPRHAHLGGFDLHGNVAVDGGDREHLEQLCRYVLRPAVAQDRLRLTGDGRVDLELKTPWADGTSHLLFEPLGFLARLATLTPRPRVNEGLRRATTALPVHTIDFTRSLSYSYR